MDVAFLRTGSDPEPNRLNFKLSRRFVYQHMIVPGSARAQHPAAGVQHASETWRSEAFHGEDTIK